MAVFRMDANHTFSNALSLAHTLSRSLRALALFPFFLFQYNNDDVAQVQNIKILTINVCGPKNKLSHFGTFLTIIGHSKTVSRSSLERQNRSYSSLKLTQCVLPNCMILHWLI